MLKEDSSKGFELNLKDEDFEILTMPEEFVHLEEKEINSKD